MQAESGLITYCSAEVEHCELLERVGGGDWSREEGVGGGVAASGGGR